MQQIAVVREDSVD